MDHGDKDLVNLLWLLPEQSLFRDLGGTKKSRVARCYLLLGLPSETSGFYFFQEKQLEWQWKLDF